MIDFKIESKYTPEDGGLGSYDSRTDGCHGLRCNESKVERTVPGLAEPQQQGFACFANQKYVSNPPRATLKGPPAPRNRGSRARRWRAEPRLQSQTRRSAPSSLPEMGRGAGDGSKDAYGVDGTDEADRLLQTTEVAQLERMPELDLEPGSLKEELYRSDLLHVDLASIQTFLLLL